MRTAVTLQIAWRNFTRNRRRFLLLGLAVAAGFFFVCSVQGLVSGLSLQISIRGARYYGGQVIVGWGQKPPEGMDIDRQDAFIRGAISRAGVRASAISHRTIFGADGIVFFNGESVRIRRVIGMDWTAEERKIRGLQFVAGDPGAMTDPRGTLISEVTARRLGARVGDLVTLQVNRVGGAVNTAPLIVKAIFREVSIFGYYTIYMDRGVLDEAMGLDPRYAGTVGVYLDDYRSASRVAARITREMGGTFTAAPVVSFMPEIRTMILALTLVSYGVLALLAVVIIVGILNLYRVIIYERTKEIGTMRAIGIQKPQVRSIILCEAFLLSLASVAAGLLASVVVLFLLGQVPFNGAAGFDIFLDRGRLSWVLYPDNLAADAVLIVLITLLGALGPAQQAQSIEPVVALRTD
jgi:putative ABC transport system permease protein